MIDKPKPWSVKGISPEARRLARQGAQQAGMPIGRWIDTIIQQQAGAPITIDPANPGRAKPAEDRIEQLVTTLNGKIDGMTMRLAMVQAGRGLPADDITRLDSMRTAGAFEYAAGEIDPAPIIAAAETGQNEAHATPARRRHVRRLGLLVVLLLIGASSSYIAIAGALTVPPAGLTNMISQLTASVGPALRDLGFAGTAPAQNTIAEQDGIPTTPLSRTSIRAPRPVQGIDSRAQNGDATAQYELARTYAEGRGRPRDEAKAAHWLTQAAAQGHAQAGFELATAYSDGRGVATNSSKAAEWYRRAAQKGHRSAQYALGLAYAEGNGVARDYGRATTWLARAATGNRADAQFALGVLHERGFATNASLQNAHRWYQAAAANGFPQAAKRAAALTKLRPSISLTPPRAINDRAGITEIQKLLTDLGFNPGPVDGHKGKQTHTAIRLYQATLGLKIDGRPTDQLLAHLRTVTGTGVPNAG